MFAEGVRDGHDALGEAAASIALRAEALLAPEDEGAEFTLGVIVGRLDAVVVGEGPESALVLEDVGAGTADTADAEAHAFYEEGLDHGSGGINERPESTTRKRAIADSIPLVDHHLRPEDQLFAKFSYPLHGPRASDGRGADAYREA